MSWALLRADRLLGLAATIILASLLVSCNAKARAQAEPPPLQPTADPTMNAVVRGLVTMTLPTSTVVARSATTGPVNQAPPAQVLSTPKPAATIAPLPTASPARTGTPSSNTQQAGIRATAMVGNGAAIANPMPPTSATERTIVPTSTPAPPATRTPLPLPDGRALPVTPITGQTRPAAPSGP